MIISISGKKFSGKDTVCKIIQYLAVQYRPEGSIGWDTGHLIAELTYGNSTLFNSYKWKRKLFADKLKDIVCLLIGCTREELEDPIFKETPLGKEWDILINYKGELVTECRLPDLRQERKMTPRLLMQLTGGDFGRKMVHPNLWITSLFKDYTGDIEQWKDIKGYEGKYQISSFGNIKSLARKSVYGDKLGDYHTVQERILKATITGKYYMIKLEGNNSVTIHSLVAEAFLGERPNGMVINHIDQNPLNNFYKNIEYTTQVRNIEEANLRGNGNIGTKQRDAKLTELEVLDIRQRIEAGESQVDIADFYNVSKTTICDIKAGRKWSHVGRNIEDIKPVVPTPTDNWIITDTRHPNECEAIKKRGGFLIRVNRPITNYDRYLMFIQLGKGVTYSDLNSNQDTMSKELFYRQDERFTSRFGPDTHESETALDNYTGWDAIITNDGTIEDLIVKVKDVLEHAKII